MAIIVLAQPPSQASGVYEMYSDYEQWTIQPPSVRVRLQSYFACLIWVLRTQPPSDRVPLRYGIVAGAKALMIDNAALKSIECV